MMTKCPQLSLYFRPIPCLPYSPLSLYLHRQPNPFSTRKLQKKERKKKKREASTVCNNDSDEFSPTFILVEITGRAANQSGEREREAERKKERIARQKRIRGIKGFAGTPLALPVQRTRTESGARGEREREKMNSGCRGKIIVSA